MDKLARLIDNIQFDKPEDLRKKAFQEFVKIENDKIPYLIRYKDENAAHVLKEIGYPRVENYLYDLLMWLQDINWPGSNVIADFLVDVGEPVVPHIKSALKEQDSIWNYWILRYIVSRYPNELVKKLEDELMNFIKSFEWDNILEGVDTEAVKIAVKNNLGDIAKISDIMKRKKSYYMDVLENVEVIEKYLK